MGVLQITLTVLKKGEAGWERDRPNYYDVLNFAWGIANRPNEMGGVWAQDVIIRRYPFDDPFKKDQHFDALRLDVRPPYSRSECLTYLFCDCIIAQDPLTEDGWEEVQFSPAQVEWHWTGRDGKEEPPCYLDMTSAFTKGTASIDLTASSRGLSFENEVVVYLRLPGLHGPSEDRDHLGWLDLSGFSVKVSHNAASNRVTHEHVIEIERRPDALSPRLTEACLNGSLLNDVALEVVSLRSRHVLLSYRFRECHISASRIGFVNDYDDERDTFFERFDISFKQIEFQYFSPKDGTKTDVLQGMGASALTIPHSRIVPRTAFIIMWMDPDQPELEEVHRTIVEVCASAGISAARADDIQHSDLITAVVLEQIQTSEFVIADLTGARPNVYYEVGHAHAIGKKPVLLRRKGSSLHFDLAVHNVKEYRNADELRVILGKRLAERYCDR